jgi:hypothetical protein
LESIPLCYYRPRICGGGSYERFYHYTIPEHPLDSASGYLGVIMHMCMCIVHVHVQVLGHPLEGGFGRWPRLRSAS